jgi:hypothetical protein
MKRLTIALLLTTLLISSCQKIRDDMLPEGRRQMYFQSILNPDSCVRVYVGQTTGIQDDINAPVNDAIVLVFFNNVFSDTLQNVEPGIYESELRPAVNDTIRIEVLSHNKMTGETVIPAPAFISSPEYEYPTWYDAMSQQNYGTLTFSINDNPEQENYYEILIYDSKYSEYSQEYWYTYISNYWTILTPDIVIQNEGDWDFIPTTLFFSDKLFNGKVNLFSFIVVNVSNDSYITLSSISKEYYYYRKYYTRHAYNAQLNSDGIRNLLFTGEPLDMYTNINGGLGVCAAFSSTTTKITRIP